MVQLEDIYTKPRLAKPDQAYFDQIRQIISIKRKPVQYYKLNYNLAASVVHHKAKMLILHL